MQADPAADHARGHDVVKDLVDGKRRRNGNAAERQPAVMVARGRRERDNKRHQRGRERAEIRHSIKNARRCADNQRILSQGMMEHAQAIQQSDGGNAVQGADNQQAAQVIRENAADIAADMAHHGAPLFRGEIKKTRPQAVNVH